MLSQGFLLCNKMSIASVQRKKKGNINYNLKGITNF